MTHPRQINCLCRALLLLIVAGLWLAVPSARAETPADGAKLSFGLVSVMSADQSARLWRPLLDALEKRLGKPVTSHTAQDYAGVIWALRNNQDQVAWLGNKSAIEAVDNAGAEVFAQAVYPNGQTGYQSFLIVPQSSPLKSLDDFFSKAPQLTFAMGDRNSTSGFVAPMFYLFAEKGEPDQMFKRVTHGNHEDNFMDVAEGRVDVATVASIHLETFAKLHPTQFGKVRVIWRSPQIPGDPLVWRKDLLDTTKTAIAQTLMGYGVDQPGKTSAQLADERKFLAEMGVGRFVPSTNQQLIPVRRLELYSKRITIKSNPSLNPEDRRNRLAEIDRQLDQLDQDDAGSAVMR